MGVRRFAWICAVAAGMFESHFVKSCRRCVERRVGLREVRIRREEIEVPVEVEGRVAEGPFGLFEPEQVPVHDGEQVVALEALRIGELRGVESPRLGRRPP